MISGSIYEPDTPRIKMIYDYLERVLIILDDPMFGHLTAEGKSIWDANKRHFKLFLPSSIICKHMHRKKKKKIKHFL